MLLTLPFLYVGLLGFNRTVVRVNSQWLTVYNGPIPIARARQIASPTMDQLFVARQLISGDRSSRYIYLVNVVTADGEHQQLPTGLSGLDNLEEALYIEQEVERYLRIADRPMDWEYSQNQLKNITL